MLQHHIFQTFGLQAIIRTFFFFLFANPIKSITTYSTPGWNYVGCVVDGPAPNTAFAPDDVRVSWDAGPASVNVDQSACLSHASVSGYVWAGVEYGTECWAGSSYRDTSYNSIVNPISCSFLCPGNPNENCGAGNRMNMWAADAVTATAAMISTDPAYIGQLSATSAASASSAATLASETDALVSSASAAQASDSSVASAATVSVSSASDAAVVSHCVSYIS